MMLADYLQELEALAVVVDDARVYLDVASKRIRIQALDEQAASPTLWDDPDRAKALLGELARLRDDVATYERLAARREDLAVLTELAREEGDMSVEDEIRDGIEALRRELAELEVRTLLGGEYDERDAVVTLHPGEGGTESQDWAEMLLRMYLRWAERHGFEAEVIDAQEGQEAGIKSATVIFRGRYAYGQLAAERGVHRLVRISPFDAQKRRHTSFAGLDVVPLLDDDAPVTINPDEIKVDVFRSSGPGGQSVNTTDSAVRITHLATGMVVTSQNERSQLQNKQTAMRVLQARLAERMREEHVQKLEELRGERRGIAFGSQIRSYVLQPYQMVKDLRSGEETSNVGAVLDGDIDVLIRSVLEWRRREAAASTGGKTG
ncbi:MAG: peptide chain release factor 2 [Acidobacteria bacterium]|nr:peptide chain release factor 2 [Acidobacteriota bacterium]